MPRFSIILPVHNGGAYLRDCVASVLAQTRPDFELLVLEDSSTDGSAEWLAARRDPRIKIHPSPAPPGIVTNWQRALALPKGEFMTILGQDDLLDPNYLEVMNTLVQDNPDAGLYFAQFRFIDATGRVRESAATRAPRETAAEFLHALLAPHRFSPATGYLMRSRQYAAVGGIPAFDGLLYADHALWLQLLQFGPLATAATECFSFRLHAQSASQTAGWHHQLLALSQFLAFLRDYAERHPEVRKVVEQEQMPYCRHALYHWYTTALLADIRAGRPVAADTLVDVQARLAPFVPEVVPQVRQMWVVRLLERVAASPGLRRWWPLFGPAVVGYRDWCKARLKHGRRWPAAAQRRLHRGTSPAAGTRE